MGKAKGTIFVKPVQVLRTYKEAARKVLPESMHHYLESSILYSAWYEETEFLALCRACAQVIPASGIDPWEQMGRLSAQIDLQGIYEEQIRAGDPAVSLKRFETLWKLHHDSGEIEVTIECPGRARVDLSGYALVSSDFCKSISGHIWGTLNQSGAEDILVSKSLCRARGDGVCSWQATWRTGPR